MCMSEWRLDCRGHWMSERLRILHAPLNIANDAWCVSRAECSLGHESDVAVVAAGSYAFAADYDLSLPAVGTFRRNAAKIGFVLGARKRYDVLHFSFATSILDYRSIGLDLIDLRLAPRHSCVVMTFHGCDVRALQPGGCSICVRPCDARPIERRFALIRKRASLLCVKTPDLLRAVPDAIHVPQAACVADVSPIPPSTSGPLRVVHAPTDRALKGTDAVIAACERLTHEGHDVELVLVEGMRHEEALAVFAGADVAVDQLKAGWYGVFAIELMALGKPVIAHIDPANLDGGGSAPPIISANETSVYDALRRCVLQREGLPSLGEHSRQYALRTHDSLAIGRRMVELYQKHCIMDVRGADDN